MSRVKMDIIWSPVRIRIVLFLLFLSIFIIGCSGTTETPQSYDDYTVDPMLREFYSYLGGEDVLGPPISSVIVQGNIISQYFETCKMIYDPEALPKKPFHLAPLGKALGYIEPPITTSVQTGIPFEGGHTIFPDFIPLYEKLGPRMVGKPLTEGRYNLIRERYEQHFENVGFYRLNGSMEVNLLPYGILACGEDCSSKMAFGDHTFDIPSYIDPAFQEFVNRLGADFTGFSLTNAYINGDGKWEQILQNVVLVADSTDNPQSVRLLPLAEKLSIPMEPPRPYSGNSEMYFYPTQGDSGYEIPIYFWEYISSHGGIQVFGLPITQVSPFIDHMLHQCFVNLCLAFDPKVNETRIRPEPLGYAYQTLYYTGKTHISPIVTSAATPIEEIVPIWPIPLNSPTIIPDLPPVTEVPLPAKPTETPPPAPVVETGPLVTDSQAVMEEREITFRIWERFPIIGSKQLQEIGISAVLNGQSLVGLLPELTITMPDGIQQFYAMPGTDITGKSTVMVPPIEAANGTIIPYLICFRLTNLDKICLEKSFIIWNYP